MSTDNTAQNPGPDDLPPPVFVAPDPPDSSQYFSNPIVEADAVRTLRDAFWRLFIGRRDTFGKRWRGSDGAPRQNEAITNEILEDHLEGRYAVHVYPQNVTDRGVKICVLDVDCHRTVPEDEVDDRAQSNFTYIEAIWRQLREMGLPVLLEDSNGRGGFHLWMFVDNLSNREAIGVTAWMASRADAGNLKVECYPGGNEISDDGFGTCIRLPGRHHTEPYFSRFWTGAGWIDAGAVVALLEQIQPVPASGLPEEALTFQPPPSTGTNGRRTTQQRAWTDPAVPPCHVIQEALTFLGPDYYDATRAEWIQIGIGIHSCVRSPEESEEYFQRFKVWSQQAPSRWNEQEAQRDWDSFRPDGLLQWRNPIRLAMDNGYEPPEQWHPDLSRHLHLDIVNAVPYERPPLTGEEVTIDVLRQAVVQCRTDSLGQPGIYLDRSGTGSGKSMADLAVAARGNRVLVIVPDHANAREIATEATSRGLQVISFPKRVFGISDADQSHLPDPAINCWNPDADRADSAGLAIQHTVCRRCQHADRCRDRGYLGAVNHARRTRAQQSGVIVMTHRRAQLAGLQNICQTYGIQYVAVHESLLEFVAPVYSLGVADVRQLLQQLQTLCASLEIVQAIGIVMEPATTDRSRFARRAFEHQEVDEASRPVEVRQRRQDTRTWIRKTIEILTGLESMLTEESVTVDPVDLADLAFPVRDYPVDDLHDLLWQAKQQAREGNTQRLGSTAEGRDDGSSTEREQNSAIRFLMEMTSRTVRRVVRIPATEASASATATAARLVAVSEVDLPTNTPVWLCDATADPEILRTVVPDIIDRTPDMHVRGHHGVLQAPDFDITRNQQTGPNSTLGRALRQVLPMFPEKRNIGVFCHRNQIDGVRQGLPENVTVHYFHSGVARGSNSLYRDHDLLMILGTPRAAGPTTVKDRLVQLGEIDALNEPGEWRAQSVQITDRSGMTRVIAQRGYGHSVWNSAYNSIVEPELQQIVGRARHVLEEGCDVLVVSSHLVASEFLEFPEISLTGAQDRVWQACKDAGETFAPRDIRRLTGMAERTVSNGIQRLVALGYIERSGTAGGRSTRYQITVRRQERRERESDADGEAEGDEDNEDEDNEW